MPETIVQCDGCGAHGRRAENAIAPDFWFLPSGSRPSPTTSPWWAGYVVRLNLVRRGASSTRSHRGTAAAGHTRLSQAAEGAQGERLR